MNVFDIIVEYDSLVKQIEELGGEITPEIAEKLNINQDELEKKIKAYYYIIKTKEAEIQLAKDEQERLMDVRKAKENVIKRLKKTVDLAVEVFGVVKPKATVKSLTFTDLIVWQKKTEALEVTGEIDDERFCNIETRFTLTYEDAKALMKLVDESGNNHLVPVNNIIVLKDKLKQWLIDNEEEHKKLKADIDPITKTKPAIIDGEKSTALVTDILTPDEKIILATELKHNSTVVFK